MKETALIRICMGPGGIASGAPDVLAAFKKALREAGTDAAFGDRCSVQTVGCFGFCRKDVLVDIDIGGTVFTYEQVTPEKADRIVREHIAGGIPVEEWLAGEEYRNFYAKQVKVVLSGCGTVDYNEISSYIAIGGYEAAKRALTGMTPAKVILEIKNAGLRGRGGAGFPTGVKWESCSAIQADRKYFICNADEGDPGAFMDRAVLEGNPHAVLEGMIIGAYAVGASTGYIYVRAEYPLAVERFGRALGQAMEMGFLGENIFGTSWSLNIEIKLGAGAFVCGEETALIASIEGERGMPRPKPPFPVQRGLWGKPTVINNVETLANIPLILARGAAWFSSYGTEKSRGTKVFSLAGKVKNTGLIEVPMGISLSDIIFGIGGGIEGNKAFKAVQTGGPSGGCIPAHLTGIPVDYESLFTAGSIMGSGGMVVFDEDDCMVNVAQYFLRFTQAESCGKCVPCRIGTKRMLEIMERITSGKGVEDDIDRLRRLGEDIRLTSLCGLGQTAPNPVLSTLTHFMSEYRAHIVEKRCPAGVCRPLLVFSIDEQRCNGCGACLRVCPEGAVSGSKKKPHRIDSSLCIRCGMCYDACKFSSIIRR